MGEIYTGKENQNSVKSLYVHVRSKNKKEGKLSLQLKSTHFYAGGYAAELVVLSKRVMFLGLVVSSQKEEQFLQEMFQDAVLVACLSVELEE